MHKLRRLFVHAPRAVATYWRNPKALAVLLVIVIPGGFALPIVYGIYGAIRHSLTPKAQSRSATANDEIAAEAPAALEPEARV